MGLAATVLLECRITEPEQSLVVMKPIALDRLPSRPVYYASSNCGCQVAAIAASKLVVLGPASSSCKLRRT